MQEDDAPTIWKTPAKYESHSPGAEQIVFPPFPMGMDIGHAARPSTHHCLNKE